VDNAWEQEKPEATLREMLAVGAAREASHTAYPDAKRVEGSGAYHPDVLAGRIIGRRLVSSRQIVLVYLLFLFLLF
jgi:hypothetical protein